MNTSGQFLYKENEGICARMFLRFFIVLTFKDSLTLVLRKDGTILI